MQAIEALLRALKINKPLIFNTDQGSQFTSDSWIKTLKAHNVLISMDSKGRYSDNIHIERFWRSLKYEEVYIKSYDSVLQAKENIGRYINFYNKQRPHQSLNYKTPEEIFKQNSQEQILIKNKEKKFSIKRSFPV